MTRQKLLGAGQAAFAARGHDGVNLRRDAIDAAEDIFRLLPRERDNDDERTRAQLARISAVVPFTLGEFARLGAVKPDEGETAARVPGA